MVLALPLESLPPRRLASRLKALEALSLPGELPAHALGPAEYGVFANGRTVEYGEFSLGVESFLVLEEK